MMIAMKNVQPQVETFDKKCTHCSQMIKVPYETFIELDECFYHKDCFKCVKCLRTFSVNDQSKHLNAEETTETPFQDSQGQLFCLLDYIAQLTCRICLKNFDTKAQIYELNATHTKVENRHDTEHKLVHAECMSCWNCHQAISHLKEYSIESSQGSTNAAQNGLVIYCKMCTLDNFQDENEHPSKKNKKLVSIHHRLSSRQKELLASKILALDFKQQEELLDYNSQVIYELALELKCSKKALAHYLNKHLLRTNLSKEEEVQKQRLQKQQQSQIKTWIDELSKVDKIIAPPNRFPFSLSLTNRQPPISVSKS
jgi:hypothetical protein